MMLFGPGVNAITRANAQRPVLIQSMSDFQTSPSHSLRPRPIATTPVRETSTSPSGIISVDEALDLVGRAGDLEHEALGGGVDHAGAKRSASRSASTR